MRVMIIEDHIKINNLITLYCQQDGFDTVSFFSAEDALTYSKNHAVDVIITDLMLKEMSGETLIQTLREVSDVYIIVVSAKTSDDERIDVLKLGADDYITKPFSIDELMVRLHNASKRLNLTRPLEYTFHEGAIRLNPIEKHVRVNHTRINLTRNEFETFLTLVNHPYQTLSRSQILEQSNLSEDAFDRVIDVYIKNIRKKLGPHKNLIKTMYGEGYQFVGERDA